MQIEIVKRDDGSGVLRCTRDDGSLTWQKQERHGPFFALHDLTHFAVESTLGFSGGFFGLVAAGWDIEDTTGKGTRGPLPPETIDVEKLVGLLISETAGPSQWTAAEFNSVWGSARMLTEIDLLRVRERCQTLFAEWQTVAVGQAMRLQWPALK